MPVLAFLPFEVSSMSQLRAFIVEDNPVIRENLIATLEELTPVTVVGTAEDETTAGSWLRENHRDCDLVIIDIFLSNGSGLGVLRTAHELQVKSRLVVLTNYATPNMRAKCLSLGATKVYDKSNELDALVEFCTRLGEAQ
jgi:DNA-binding NarL/FixJ family response regulator